MKAIENDFPIEFIDKIAETESYRKDIYRPIYHIHKWWAKRLGSVFREIVIGSSSEEWDDFYSQIDYDRQVVLDPFMGSGTTLGEALKLGCKVIGNDINPVSTFIVKQALTHIDKKELIVEFKEIEKDISARIKKYYKTQILGEDELADVLYYFWVKVVTTPDGESLPLFSNYIFSKNAYPSRKPESKVVCPHCYNIFTCLYNSTSECCPECNNSFNPQIGIVKGEHIFDSKGNKHKIRDLINATNNPPQHKLYAILAISKNQQKVYIKPSQYDFDLFDSVCDELQLVEATLPLPKMKVREGHNTNQAKKYNYNNWWDFFNPRQLLSLGILYKRILEIENQVLREQFITLFSTTLEYNNIFCSFKGEGTGAVRPIFFNHILKPEKTPLENNVWGTDKSSGSFSKLFTSKLLKAKQYLCEPFELQIIPQNGENKAITKKIVCSNAINPHIVDNWHEFENSDVLLLNGNGGNLPIPDNVVDSIVTDPPYFDFIHYSELSDFFYSWIREGLSEYYPYFQRSDSSDTKEVQDKDSQRFSEKIANIFKECYRVLKNDSLMSFSFHHSSFDGWLAIYSALIKSGFNIISAYPVKAEMDVASPKSTTKQPINIDSIIICKKTTTIKDHSKVNVLANYQNYLDRFALLNRTLSDSDKFVILASQLLVYGSNNSLSGSELKLLYEANFAHFH